MFHIFSILLFLYSFIFVHTFAKSAHETKKIEKPLPDKRITTLETVFKNHNSPLTSSAYDFVRYADMYNIDWRLLPAISGQESQFGTLMIDGTYNAYGWDQGYMAFSSWAEGIQIIDKALKENYIGHGATTISEIAAIYAEDPNWPNGVSGFFDEINREYSKEAAINPTQYLTGVPLTFIPPY